VDTYQATTFAITPQSGSSLDVLAAGGSLTVTLDGQNVTSGTLNVPASFNGGTAFVANIVGTVTITGSTVRFQQTEDTFVRDLEWQHTDGCQPSGRQRNLHDYADPLT
jgi:hypothetical protein